MISIQAMNIRLAQAHDFGGQTYVTLHFGARDRLVIHTRTMEQAVTIAETLNEQSAEPDVIEAEAQAE